MKWILIAILGSNSLSMQEFDTELACKDASAWIVKNAPAYNRIVTDCKPKSK